VCEFRCTAGMCVSEYYTLSRAADCCKWAVVVLRVAHTLSCLLSFIAIADNSSTAFA
jgi:hypothetical protein